MILYSGNYFNKDREASFHKPALKNVGSIIAKYIDPSIKPTQIKLNPPIEQSEGKYSYNQHTFLQAMDITITSLFWTACVGVLYQKYFSA